MLRIAVDSLKPGMRVARPVYSAGGQILLNVGKQIEVPFISRLQQMGVPAIYIQDASSLDLVAEDVITENTRVQAIKNVKSMMDIASNQLRSGRPIMVKIEEVQTTVQDIIEQLLTSRKLMINLIDIRVADDYTFAHSVNVCVLALVTGMALKYSKLQLSQLGMGALLHDMGKVMVPIDILNKPGALTAAERQEIEAHSTYGWEMLQQQKTVPNQAALAVYEHHERYDGQGYPRRLAGDNIHVFAQVVGVADVYDALTADRVYRKAHLPHEAIEYIAGAGNFLFDYGVIKAFLKHVAAYPIGTVVRLNTGETGVVVDTPAGYSQRPEVKILLAADGRRVQDGKVIKLTEATRTMIQEVVPPERWLELEISDHGSEGDAIAHL